MKGEASAAVEMVEGMEREPATGAPDAAGADDGEFQLTIRKLELPVRPRGVLAE